MQMGGVGGAQQQWKTCPRCRQRNPKEGPNNHIVCGSNVFASAVLSCCWVGACLWLKLCCRGGCVFASVVLRCVAGLARLAVKSCRRFCFRTYECRAAGLVSQSLSGC